MRRLILACACAASAARFLGAPPRPIDPSDVRRIVTYSAVSIAPDGRHVVAIQRHPDFKDNRNVSQRVLSDVRTHLKRVLTPYRKSVQSPTWSANGERIGFISPGG